MLIPVKPIWVCRRRLQTWLALTKREIMHYLGKLNKDNSKHEPANTANRLDSGFSGLSMQAPSVVMADFKSSLLGLSRPVAK